jgi:hypothetical protein
MHELSNLLCHESANCHGTYTFTLKNKPQLNRFYF